MKTNSRKNTKENKRLIKLYWGFLLLPTVLWIIVCIIGLVIPQFKEGLDFSLNENRNKAKFPDTVSSEWFGEFEKYYNDRAPFRSALISLNNNLSKMVEAPYENGIKDTLIALFHNDNPKPSTEHTDSQTPQSTEEVLITLPSSAVSQTEGTMSLETESENVSASSEATSEEPTETIPAPPTVSEDVLMALGSVDTEGFFPPVVKNGFTLLGREDWLFMYGNDNINFYLGNNLLDEGTMQSFLSSMTRLNEICKQKGKELVYLIPPNKEEVYSEYMPSYEIENDYKRVPRLIDYIKANSDINIIYPKDELIAIKPYYLSYIKYDSHWNSVGAFIGYQKVLESLHMPVTNILDLEVTPQIVGGGDLIAPGSLSYGDYMNDRAYQVGYKPDMYAYEVYGSINDESQMQRFVSVAENDKKIVIIGDSFKNHTADFIFKDFKETTYIHIYLLGQPEYDQYIKDADVILYLFVERNDRFWRQASDYVSELLS